MRCPTAKIVHDPRLQKRKAGLGQCSVLAWWIGLVTPFGLPPWPLGVMVCDGMRQVQTMTEKWCEVLCRDPRQWTNPADAAAELMEVSQHPGIILYGELLRCGYLPLADFCHKACKYCLSGSQHLATAFSAGRKRSGQHKDSFTEVFISSAKGWPAGIQLESRTASTAQLVTTNVDL